MLGLALSGGAARGAWQGGRLTGLLKPWEVVAGVSVGAINAAHLAQYPIGQEAEALVALSVLWHQIKTKNVYRRWFPFGKMHALWRTGVYDLYPLYKFLRNHLDIEKIRTSGRRLRVGAVNYATREWTEWTDADVTISAVLASCAIPYAFEPVSVDGVLYQDGGVRTVVPIESLVNAGCDEADAVVCFPELPPVADQPSNALEAGLTAVDTQTYQIIEDDLKQAAPLASFWLHRTDRDLGDGLDFSPATNAWRWELGESA